MKHKYYDFVVKFTDGSEASFRSDVAGDWYVNSRVSDGTSFVSVLDPMHNQVGYFANKFAIDSFFRLREKPVKKNGPTKQRPNKGSRWTPEEEDKLKLWFESDATVRKIAKEFGRSSVAIRARLVKLGLIEKREDAK